MKHQLRDEPQAWTYDANGNRLTQTGDQPSTYIVSGTSNRLSSISGASTRSYAYNASGSVTGDGAATFTYDDAGHLIGEYDNSGALIHETVWLGDIPVATIRPNGASVDLFYVHADHLDTPRRISRPSDNVIVWRWDFDPYGTNAANQDPDGDTQAFVHGLRFPGQYLDSKTGLHYNYFRDYDPATGRYIESDPIGLSGGINTYGYAYASPLEFIDPLGLFGECTKLMCIPGFAKDRLTSSKLIDEGAWRLENIHVAPVAPRAWTPNRDKAPSNPFGSQTALCFFAKTRSYREEYSTQREWKCLEMCYDCGPRFRETSYTEYLGSYEKIRREREQMIQQIRHMIPLFRCMEILRGLR